MTHSIRFPDGLIQTNVFIKKDSLTKLYEWIFSPYPCSLKDELIQVGNYFTTSVKGTTIDANKLVLFHMIPIMPGSNIYIHSPINMIGKITYGNHVIVVSPSSPHLLILLMFFPCF